MFEMIIGLVLIIAGGSGIFAMCEEIGDYMDKHNHVTQLD